MSARRTEKGAAPRAEDPVRLKQEGWITRFSRATERKVFFYLTLLAGAWWVIAQFCREG